MKNNQIEVLHQIIHRMYTPWY